MPEMIALASARMPDQEWIVADMRRLTFDRRFDAILAWDSYFPSRTRLGAMFAIFDAYATKNPVLMFNTGPDRGEATSTSRLNDERFYHASVAPAGTSDAPASRLSTTLPHPRQPGRTALICRRKRA